MSSRTSREVWDSFSTHDDVNLNFYSLLPILCAFLMAYEHYNLEMLRWIFWIFSLLAVGGTGQWRLSSRPAQMMELLAPPQMVIGRRRFPKVYCCRRRSDSRQVTSSVDSVVQFSQHVPALNVLIMITGTHGDVAPFVALAHELQRRYGHRIRFATHLAHREYVLKEGLDFYPLAGDPRILSQWMVQSQGRLLPDIHAPLTKLREEMSEIVPAKLAMINDIMESTWPACVEELPEEMAAKRPRFVAHAIISNPVTYGHIHCASALNIPLHMAFPQPWTPTAEYPHPFVRGTAIPNRITYQAFDQLTSMGLNVNQWRTDTLNLPPLRGGDRGAHVLNDLRVPFSYLWSPALSPKPPDWGDHVDVIGALVHDTTSASEYEPAPELARFLQDGPKPIFVGFGSMVIDDPDRLFGMLTEAAARTGARMIVQSSWSKIGGDVAEVPSGVYLLGGCPHSWLLPRCSAVVHHGGAGTVAAGLRFGLPTFVVPFFGDQHFWGDVVQRAGAGPAPCPYKELCADRIADAVEQLRSPQIRKCASDLEKAMSKEDGIAAMCDSFTKNLPISYMVCLASLFARSEPRVVVAEKWHPGMGLRLSQEAHTALHASHLASAFPCDYGYILWDAHAPAFFGNGLLMVLFEVAQGALQVLLALLSPGLELVNFFRDWHEKGGRSGIFDLVSSGVLILLFSLLCLPVLVVQRLLLLLVKSYMAGMEYLLRLLMLQSRLLVHVRARHRCVRPAVAACQVPRGRQEDLVRAAVVAEHVLGVVALAQHRCRSKLRAQLSRQELLRALHVLRRCPAPRGVPGRCARAAWRARRLWSFLRVACTKPIKADEARDLEGWEVGESVALTDFCLQYADLIHASQETDCLA
jgi:UDP:flavonoid glycosyltransferase YjiC (YdhE family)